MRNFIILVVLMTGLVSCTKESLLKDQAVSQKWVLVRMTAWGFGTTMGPNMGWQEYFVFNVDGSFTKYRMQGNVTKSATGTFVTISEFGQQLIELTYTGGDDLKASCFPKERLEKVSDDLLRGQWGACDGPTLEYVRSVETEQ